MIKIVLRNIFAVLYPIFLAYLGPNDQRFYLACSFGLIILLIRLWIEHNLENVIQEYKEITDSYEKQIETLIIELNYPELGDDCYKNLLSIIEKRKKTKCN